MITPIKISPFARRSSGGGLTLQQIVDKYGFLNFWSAENLTIIGTTTTANDYKGEHNLVNPAATNQPNFNSASANFGGKPTLTFNGTTNYLTKNVANWRGSDSTGVFFSIYKIISGNTTYSLTTSDLGSSLYYQVDNTTGNNSQLLLRILGVNTAMRGSSNIVGGSPIIIQSHACTGSQYLIVINSVSESVTAVTGVNNGGNWLANIPNRDDISIGVRRISLSYANIEWFCSGYLPYTSESNIIDLQNDIKNYLGI